MSDFRRLTRRSFLSLPAIIPLAGFGYNWRRGTAAVHHFTFDHVVGTSLDIDLWSDSPAAAEHAVSAVLDEIERLTAVLSTRDHESEISRMAAVPGARPSPDLASVLAAYDAWAARTGGVLSITPGGPGTASNVDALGKAYILDRAATVAADSPGVDGVLLNIGGDIVVRGRGCDVAVADPAAWQDNAAPLTWVRLRNQAIATSGSYARGSHLVDARTGRAVRFASSASVIAPTAVDANALATTLCVTSAAEGLRLVESTWGAEAIRIDADGGLRRSTGFAEFERPRIVPARAAANWPAGYELNISLTLTAGTAGGGQGGFGGFGRRGRRGAKRPFIAVWIEDTSGRLVRVLAFWADNPRYYDELSSFYSIAGRSGRRLSAIARATRPAGSYSLVWDGLDDKQAPVASGNYRVVVESNQEHGSYGKQSGVIACADKPAQITLSSTANFEPVAIEFGPRPSRV
jgi:thiamine biosynthesis lipoprotein ApbE